MDARMSIEAAFIQMFENSVKAQKLTDSELLSEVCKAFFDQEIYSWKDALLNELMTRFQAAVRRKATPDGLA